MIFLLSVPYFDEGDHMDSGGVVDLRVFVDSPHIDEGRLVFHLEAFEEARQGVETVTDIFTVSISA